MAAQDIELILMSKMTKAQQKRMINDIQKKAGKLFMSYHRAGSPVFRGSDFSAIEKICKAALKRLG
jgi:hypothetical protein